MKRSLQHSVSRFRSRRSVHIFPNILTLLGLLSGLLAIRYGFEENWHYAVSFILGAAFLDFFDGYAARSLGGGSRFGGELDSLSDFISFGLAPPLVIFLWEFSSFSYSWFVVSFYVVCAALRLARFNVSLDDDESLSQLKVRRYYFRGLPTPGAAIFCLVPLMIFFHFGSAYAAPSWLIAGLLIFCGLLMVSSLPTFSFRGLRVSASRMVILLLCFTIFVTFLVTWFWLTMIFLVSLYGLSLPVSIFLGSRRDKEESLPRVL